MDDERLERILDAGIAGYGVTEPLAGMEGRILARVAERPRRRMSGWWLAMAGGLAGMAVVVLTATHKSEGQLAPVQKVAEVRPVTMAVTAMPARDGRRHVPRRVKGLAKLRTFPTPTPLTQEERLLVAMVRQDPDRTAEAFESLRKRSEPIEIAPLMIAPLEQ